MCFLCFSAADSFASLQIVGGIDMKQIMYIMDQNVFYLYFLLLSKCTQISPVILNTNVWPNPLNPMQMHALCRIIDMPYYMSFIGLKFRNLHILRKKMYNILYTDKYILICTQYQFIL